MSKAKPKAKLPVDAFPKCPNCLYKHWLVNEGIHVFCHFCGWNSIQAYVDAGGVDSSGKRRIDNTLATLKKPVNGSAKTTVTTEMAMVS